MNRVILNLILAVWSTSLASAGALADPAPPVTKHIEIAGTLLVDADGTLVLRSNGHHYRLTIDADEPGVSSLKAGMAIIVKGMLTIADEPGSGQVRTLRPDEMIIRGHVYDYGDPPAQ
jgi:hypothetical protein